MSTQLDDLKAQQELLESVRVRTAHLVHLARLSGSSWQEIGDVLGMTRQAAWSKYRVLLFGPLAKPDDVFDGQLDIDDA